MMYVNGEGVIKEYAKAAEWFSRSAEQGHADAQVQLGVAYHFGRGVKQSYFTSSSWMRKAALQGHRVATKYLDTIIASFQARDEKQDPLTASDLILRNIVDYKRETSDFSDRLPSDRMVNLKNFAMKNPDSECLTDRENAKIQAAQETIDQLVGLDEVKAEIAKLIAVAETQAMRREKGLKTSQMSLHLVFTGNPGTGKTTVAREIGKIYKALGFLQEGHLLECQRQDLIAEFIGQTAPKVEKVLTKAKGGVLFIDEAYSLSPPATSNDFGQEAITALIAAMENNRDSLAVIVAGYPKEMERFIQSNPGLKSRFTRYIHFEDYSSEELTEIFISMAAEQEYTLHEDAVLSLRNHMYEAWHGRAKDFGNGRYVRNVLELVLEKHALRVQLQNLKTREELSEITAADIPEPKDMPKMK